jgi:Spy/CpxP family protein refolding chaperone
MSYFRGLGLSLALLMPLALTGIESVRGADEPKSKAEAKTKAPAKGRLPQYYSKADVDEKQKAEIYKIQADYEAQIDKLTAELTALKAKRDAEIRAVLTKEQQKKLDAAIEDAKKGKEKPAAEKAAADK